MSLTVNEFNEPDSGRLKPAESVRTTDPGGTEWEVRYFEGQGFVARTVFEERSYLNAASLSLALCHNPDDEIRAFLELKRHPSPARRTPRQLIRAALIEASHAERIPGSTCVFIDALEKIGEELYVELTRMGIIQWNQRRNDTYEPEALTDD